MRLFLFVLIALGLALYTCQPVVQLFGIQKKRLFTLFYLGFSVLLILLSFLLFSKFAESSNKIWRTYIPTALFILCAGQFVFAMFIALDDLRRLIQWIAGRMYSLDKWPERSTFIRNLGAIVAAIPVLSLSWGVLRNAYRYKLHHTKLKIPGLDPGLNGFRIVQISDIHAGTYVFSKPIENGIQLINDQKPHLVLFTGDVVNNKSDELLPFEKIFEKIKAEYGVYAVLGNHDYGDYHRWPSDQAKKENMHLLEEIYQRMGWHLLRNENLNIRHQETTLALVGVENFSGTTRFPKYGNLVEAMQGVDPKVFTILMSHDPTHWDFEIRPKFPQINLTLSGHTHGFQFGIEIPGFIRWSPAKWIYKQWAGLYAKDSQYLYVNRGFGVLGYPGRVGILPEVSLIELIAA